MGVDFALRAVRQEREKFVEVTGKDVPTASFRYTLTDPPFSLKARKTIERLAGRKLSFDFYDNLDSSGYGGEGKDVHWEPEGVLETLRALKSALWRNRRKLPVFYWFKRSDKELWEGSMSVFVDEVYTHLQGGWDSCFAFAVSGPGKKSRERDISDVKRIICREALYRREQGKWVEVAGQGIAVDVLRDTMYGYWKGALDEMIRVCRYAAKRGFYVQGFLW